MFKLFALDNITNCLRISVRWKFFSFKNHYPTIITRFFFFRKSFSRCGREVLVLRLSSYFNIDLSLFVIFAFLPDKKSWIFRALEYTVSDLTFWFIWLDWLYRLLVFPSFWSTCLLIENLLEATSTCDWARSFYSKWSTIVHLNIIKVMLIQRDRRHNDLWPQLKQSVDFDSLAIFAIYF